jgi:hypothetical protein
MTDSMTVYLQDQEEQPFPCESIHKPVLILIFLTSLKTTAKCLPSGNALSQNFPAGHNGIIKIHDIEETSIFRITSTNQRNWRRTISHFTVPSVSESVNPSTCPGIRVRIITLYLKILSRRKEVNCKLPHHLPQGLESIPMHRPIVRSNVLG